MTSKMKFTPDPYSTRQNRNILTGDTHYNGRVNLEEPENVNARFQMFEKIAIKNKATEYRDPLTNVWEDTQLSNVFFSQGNVQILQNGLRAGVHKRSGERELVIPPQSIDVLKTFMRDTFINYSTFEPTNVTDQVARLNKLLLEQLVPVLYSEAIGYLKYLEDQSTLVVPIALPQQSDRVYKQLELKPYM
jgi:hypothetical protein